MALKRRFYLVVLSIFIVVMLGSTGYYLIFGNDATFMDCIYMTVISITTVGYGEVINVSGNTTARIFTMILITFGMGIILYGISTLTAILLEGELSGILRKNKMNKRISNLSNHYIVCGGGETGRSVLIELNKNHEQIVLIEINDEIIEKCRNVIKDLLYVKGDATDDENLINSGINKARGIIVSLPSDKDNVYVTMTARMINPGIRIISRMTSEKLKPKLYRAGANGVVSPNAIGALRLASEMIRPAVVDFLDTMLRSSHGNLRINQLKITENSRFAGKQIKDTGIKDKFNLLVLGAKDKDDETEFNPVPNRVLKADTILIVMGKTTDFTRAKQWISN